MKPEIGQNRENEKVRERCFVGSVSGLAELTGQNPDDRKSDESGEETRKGGNKKILIDLA